MADAVWREKRRPNARREKLRLQAGLEQGQVPVRGMRHCIRRGSLPQIIGWERGPEIARHGVREGGRVTHRGQAPVFSAL